MINFVESKASTLIHPFTPATGINRMPGRPDQHFGFNKLR